jgi:signal recognition particle GTPase
MANKIGIAKEAILASMTYRERSAKNILTRIFPLITGEAETAENIEVLLKEAKRQLETIEAYQQLKALIKKNGNKEIIESFKNSIHTL